MNTDGISLEQRWNILWFVISVLWVSCGFATYFVMDAREKSRLRRIAREFAGKDIVSLIATTEDAQWDAYRDGFARQLHAIGQRVKETRGIALVRAPDGTMPFAFLRDTLPLLQEIYLHAQRGENDCEAGRLFEMILARGARVGAAARAVLANHEWRRYERLVADIRQMRSVLDLAARERLLMPPVTPGCHGFWGLWWDGKA